MITVETREDFLKQVKKHFRKKLYCVELGVLYGDFSQLILDILKPEWLILVDPYQTNGTKYQSGLTTAYSTDKDYDNLVKRFNAEIITAGVSVYRMESYKAKELFINGYFDFIYVDASHLYEDVKRDLEDWSYKLDDGGLICGHDYTEHEDFGVIKAVDEFMKEHNFEMILFNKNGGDYALKKK